MYTYMNIIHDRTILILACCVYSLQWAQIGHKGSVSLSALMARKDATQQRQLVLKEEMRKDLLRQQEEEWQRQVLESAGQLLTVRNATEDGEQQEEEEGKQEKGGSVKNDHEHHLATDVGRGEKEEYQQKVNAKFEAKLHIL